MDEQRLFVLADRTLERVVHKIRTDQWNLVLPDAITPRQPGMTLKQVINYHAYDEAWVPDVLAGKTIEEVGTKYDGDLLGSDPAASYSEIVELAVAAVEHANNLGRMVHLSYGDFPAREYLQHISSFRGFRAYDLAVFIGVDPKLPPELVQGMWDLLGPHMDEWRAIGIYGPAVPVPDDASLHDRLLGLSGRDPAAKKPAPSA